MPVDLRPPQPREDAVMVTWSPKGVINRAESENGDNGNLLLDKDGQTDLEGSTGAVSRPGGEAYISPADAEVLFQRQRSGRYRMCKLGLLVHFFFDPNTSLDLDFKDVMASGGGARSVFTQVTQINIHCLM